MMHQSKMAPTSGTKSTDAGIDQVFDLLATKDDTSLFVGLSLLRSYLDSRPDVQKDTGKLLEAWNAIQKSFLRRLLRTRPSKTVGEEDARSMNNLAVAIVHSFVNLLPQEELGSQDISSLVLPLAQAIQVVEEVQRMLVWQCLQCIGATHQGAKFILDHKTEIDEAVAGLIDDDRHLEQLVTLLRLVRHGQPSNWDDWVCSLLKRTESRPAVLFTMLSQVINSTEVSSIMFVDDLFCADPHVAQTSELDQNPWLDPSISILKRGIVRTPTPKVRTASVLLAGSLLRHLPPSRNFPAVLFGDSVELQPGDPRFSQIFVKLLLVDIRASIPSLLSSIADPSYPTIALRLAMSYELVGAFTMILLQSLGEDDEDNQNVSDDTAVRLDPDSILTLQTDLTETFSLTLEFLRDRWDASVAGAAGLHPDSRISDGRQPNTRLQLSWDNPTLSPLKDPIVISALRVLALWLCEDANSHLHKQAVGLMDMLLSLYSASTHEMGSNDFRHAILTLLTGLFTHDASEAAVQDFLAQGGWDTLAADLAKSLPPRTMEPHVEEIVRVLEMVVTSDTVYQTKEAWLQIIKAGASIEVEGKGDTPVLNCVLATWQLAASLFEKAPKRLRERYTSDIGKVRGKAIELRSQTARSQSGGFLEELNAVIIRLDTILS